MTDARRALSVGCSRADTEALTPMARLPDDGIGGTQLSKAGRVAGRETVRGEETVPAPAKKVPTWKPMHARDYKLYKTLLVEDDGTMKQGSGKMTSRKVGDMKPGTPGAVLRNPSFDRRNVVVPHTTGTHYKRASPR
eukprot:7966611-Pyramimonas_sp.AAC.1